LRRAEGGSKNFGVFRVKNHDFTPKNLIFPILGGGAREIFGVFLVKTHDFTPKKSYFYPPRMCIIFPGNKTDRHDIAEILALGIIILTLVDNIASGK
jgi:hypothetical protein